MSTQEVQDLARILRQGTVKAACDYIKSILARNESINIKKQLVWRGWLRGLESKDPSSLISRLANGIEKKALKTALKELRAMDDMVEIQDPQRHDQKQTYFREWIRLIRDYQKIPPPAENQLESPLELQ